MAVNDLRPRSSFEERWLMAHDLFDGVGRSLEEVVGKETVGRIGRVSRGLSVYGAAEAGNSSFTQTLAFEVGRYGINVNAVSPRTTMVEHSLQARRYREQTLGKEAVEQKCQRQFRLHPAQFYGELGQPEDVANVVVLLCSNRARWVTGQSISVSGGYHMH